MNINSSESAFKETRTQMINVIKHIKKELAGIRTGRASIGILNSVQVELYGTKLPLNQCASLSVPDPTLILATPFDPSQISSIEKAITGSNLGLNPNNDGKVVRIPIPTLTDERRRELSKLVHKLTEGGRNSARQVRREAIEALKKLLKKHEIGEDEERKAIDEIQKITDRNVGEINELQKAKDEELLNR